MRYRVSCTTKHEKHELITHLGVYDTSAVWFYYSEAQVIRMMEVDHDTFYVERPSGHVVEVTVAERGGSKYLKTVADGEKPNNLLNLVDCPKSSSSSLSSIGTAVGTVIGASSHGPDNG